jgi:hypothetical protein
MSTAGSTGITIEGTSFQNNSKGIYVAAAVTDVHVNFNNIVGNIMGVDNTSPTTLNATYNWWGDVSGPSGVGLGTGDAVSANVNYDPWLNAPYPEGTPISGTGKKGTVNLGETFDAIAEAGVEVLTSGTGSIEIGALNYTRNPGAAFGGDIGKYVDVWISTTTGVTEIEIRLYYTDAEIHALGLYEPGLVMYWWNGAAWVACSDTGVNTEANYIWAKITAGTTPNLNDLMGDPFGGGFPPIGGELVPASELVYVVLMQPSVQLIIAMFAIMAVLLALRMTKWKTKAP